MPKENINDWVTDGFRMEVSWRAEERVCPCGMVWAAAVATCPECGRADVPVTSGHVQVASVNQHSKFAFNKLDGEPEPFDGWRVTLDTDGIDRAIAALVRAQKMAFPDDTEDLLYEAWGIIANAGWDAHRPNLTNLEKSPGWHEAAIRWRDRYHARLSRNSTGGR